MKNVNTEVLESGRRLARRMTRKPSRLLWFAPLLMALDSPGCVMSQHPLTRVQRDAVDTAIVGEWAEEDSPESLALWIGIKDSDTMEFRLHEDDGSTIVLTGYRSSVGQRTYANLQFIDADCTDCSEIERNDIRAEFRKEYAAVTPDNPANTCTWMILPYSTSDGTLEVSFLDTEAIAESIASGVLNGSYDPEPASDFDPPTCVTASRRQFRRFLDANFDAVIPEDFTLVYVRLPAGAGRQNADD